MTSTAAAALAPAIGPSTRSVSPAVHPVTPALRPVAPAVGALFAMLSAVLRALFAMLSAVLRALLSVLPAPIATLGAALPVLLAALCAQFAAPVPVDDLLGRIGVLIGANEGWIREEQEPRAEECNVACDVHDRSPVLLRFRPPMSIKPAQLPRVSLASKPERSQVVAALALRRRGLFPTGLKRAPQERLSPPNVAPGNGEQQGRGLREG